MNKKRDQQLEVDRVTTGTDPDMNSLDIKVKQLLQLVSNQTEEPNARHSKTPRRSEGQKSAVGAVDREKESPQESSGKQNRLSVIFPLLALSASQLRGRCESSATTADTNSERGEIPLSDKQSGNIVSSRQCLTYKADN